MRSIRIAIGVALLATLSLFLATSVSGSSSKPKAVRAPAPQVYPALEDLNLSAWVKNLSPRHPVVHKSAAPADPTYVVVAGDSLYSIAAKFNTNLKALVTQNHISNPNLVVVGQVLHVTPGLMMPGVVSFPAPPAPQVQTVAAYRPGPVPAPAPQVFAAGAGVYSYSMLESLWVSVGGPAWAESRAASIALCESGGRPWAHNPSGATGLWQILGSVVPGNLYDPTVNAENAVKKFQDSGDTFSQWVCQ